MLDRAGRIYFDRQWLNVCELRCHFCGVLIGYTPYQYIDEEYLVCASCAQTRIAPVL